MKSFEMAGAMANRKILVMDDEESIRRMLGKMLKHIGYFNVEFARDGAEAVQMYVDAKKAGFPFDVVIMDLVIAGGVGGKDAIKWLLQVDPQAKVIVSSGSSGDLSMLEYKQNGFVAALPKPYTLDDLRNVLSQVFNMVK